MDRIDRLIIKASPKVTLTDHLKDNNPYLGKSKDELIDCLGPEYNAPDRNTPEWNRFIYALVAACEVSV